MPAALPATPILAIAPPSTSPLGTVTGTLTNPGIGSLDPTDPILRYVDLSTVHVGQAQKLELPAWARAVIPGPGTSPLLYSGEPRRASRRGPRVRAAPVRPAAPGRVPGAPREPRGRAAGRLADPRRRDRARQPGHARDPRRGEGRPRRAAGRERRRAARADGQRRERHVRADRPPRRVHRHPDRGSRRVPHRRRRPPPRRPTATPGASAGAAAGSPGASPTFRPADPGAPVKFAVDMLDVGESRIAPGDAAKISGLGTRCPGARRPGATPPSGPTPATRSGSRSCWWRSWS